MLKVYSRTVPKEVVLLETYRYVQEISRNPFIEEVHAPQGKIQVQVPYDGYKHFSAQAFEDVSLQLERDNSTEVANTLFGHLAFSNTSNIEFKDKALNRFSSIPLEIPVNSPDIKKDDVCRDKFKAKINWEYDIESPEIPPIDVFVHLTDDVFEHFISAELTTEKDFEKLRDNIQDIHSQYSLFLMIQVQAKVPKSDFSDDCQPVLKKLSLNWPTVTSSDSIELVSHDISTCQMSYNPLSKGWEWRNIHMRHDMKASSNDFEILRSETVLMNIKQPGELYHQDTLQGKAKVEIEDFLLSSIGTRYFDGTGKHIPSLEKSKTIFESDFHLILDDAFAQRLYSPTRIFNFDGVIPEIDRINDIKSILIDRGFKAQKKSFNSQNFLHYLEGQKLDGPIQMTVKIVITGKLFPIEIVKEIEGGKKVKSNRDSGDIKIYILGKTSASHEALILEIDAIQNAINDRFERIRVN